VEGGDEPSVKVDQDEPVESGGKYADEVALVLEVLEIVETEEYGRLPPITSKLKESEKRIRSAESKADFLEALI
ncbi:hypothetical protein PFISCL1PPCAC_23277, partial [Pristionchus fissidentatus]